MAATVFLDIYLNWLSKVMHQSLFSDGEFILPDLNKYQSLPLKIRLTAPDPNQIPAGFSLVPIAGLTLKVSINDTLDDATPLAMQDTWTKDTTANTFSGTLELNTSAMNTYIGSSDTVTGYFQIEVSDSGGSPVIIYRRTVNLRNSVTQPATTAPDVNNTYYTAQQTDGLFLKPVGGAGQFHTIVSPSGTFQRIIGVDDGGNPVDQILPYP